MFGLLIFSALFLAFVVVIWFETDAFEEYAKLLKFGQLIQSFRNYQMIKNQGSTITYLEYLMQFYNNFFVRLITCEICLITWMGTIGGTIMYTIGLRLGYCSYVTGLGYELSLPYLILLFYRIIKKLK